MTLKFLNDAPAEPPRNPFSIFVGEKRPGMNGPAAQPSGLELRKASVEEAGEPKKKKSKQEAKDEA